MKELPDWKVRFARLAADVSNYRFTGELTPTQQAVARNLQAGNRKARNVYFIGLRWVVKYYCSGVQCTWGSFPLHEYASAFRLADLINLRLFDRRVKATRPLSDDTLNITLARAQADNEFEGTLVSLLIQMETLLPEKEERPSQAGKARMNSLQRYAKFESTLLNAMTEFARLTDQSLGAMAKRLSDELTALRYEIASLRTSNGLGQSQVLQRNIITIEPCGIPAAVPHPYIGDPMLPAITCGAFAGIVTPATKENTCCGSVEQDAIVNPQ